MVCKDLMRIFARQEPLARTNRGKLSDGFPGGLRSVPFPSTLGMEASRRP